MWTRRAELSKKCWRKSLKADRKSTRLNSSHSQISYAVFCLKKKNKPHASGVFVCEGNSSRGGRVSVGVFLRYAVTLPQVTEVIYFQVPQSLYSCAYSNEQMP